MVDRNKLQNKIALQKTRNIMSEIRGIQVLGYEENPFSEELFRKIGFFSNDKKADLKIPNDTNAYQMVTKIYDRIIIKDSQIWYLLINGFLVKFVVTDTKTAMFDIWDKTSPDSKGFVLINENKDTMYDLGSDSRDEDNYLFDIYSLL
jgi:hypothetical protein